jgi:hypothetical protein
MTVQHEWYDDDGVRYCQRCGIAEAARSSMDCPDPRVSGGGRAGVVELTRELVGIRFDAECAAEGYAGLDDEVSAVFERLAERAALAVGGGVEPSREERHFDDRTYWDQYDALRDANKKLAAVEARVVELEGALESAIYLAEDNRVKERTRDALRAVTLVPRIAMTVRHAFGPTLGLVPGYPNRPSDVPVHPHLPQQRTPRIPMHDL